MDIAVDLLSAFEQSDFMGKAIVVFLLCISGISWAIVIYKWFTFKLVKLEEAYFFKNYYKNPRERAEIFMNIVNYKTAPVAVIFQHVFSEYWLKKRKKLPMDISHFQTMIENQIERRIHSLQKHLIVLGTTANVSPLIGLFGTVWGILGVFQKLGLLGSAELVTLAPGISTALLTTIVGLFAAVPAVYFYNKFNRTVEDILVGTEIFSADLLNWLGQELGQKVPAKAKELQEEEGEENVEEEFSQS